MHNTKKLLLFISLTTSALSIVLSPTIFNPIPKRTVYICNASIYSTISIGGSQTNPGFNTISCVNNGRLKIYEATYGIKRDSCKSFGTNTTTNICTESVETLSIVKKLCNGLNNCHISSAVSGLKFPNFCPFDDGIALRVTYTCNQGLIMFHPFSNGNAPHRGLSNKNFQQRRQMNNNTNSTNNSRRQS